jgi:tetratricopeptide (TPR) repeat protein
MLMLLDDYQAAHDDFGRALQLEPENVSAMVLRGGSLLAQKDYFEASTVLEVAVKVDADRSDAWYNLGIAYLRMG